MTKTKLRQGIGWVGKIHQYSGFGYVSGAKDIEKANKTLNKLPEFKRAAKKRQRRDDLKYSE